MHGKWDFLLFGIDNNSGLKSLAHIISLVNVSETIMHGKLDYLLYGID